MNDVKKKRVLSGVQPTGRLHIGTYVGALRQWKLLQETTDSFFCVVDLHAVTIPEAIAPDKLRAKTREVAGLYVASGIDPVRSTLFVQSEVTAHAELSWLLTCLTPLGWLYRMTQFKAKGGENESVGSGLLVYPVLQAADILLYDTDLVPVGEDQKQHIELCRDVATRFNHLYGETFKLPAAMIPPTGARIMGLDDPTAKMSKSTGEKIPGHAIGMLDPPKVVEKAIKRAVTDLGQEFRDEASSPGIKNLITLFESLSGEPRDAIIGRYQGQGYGYLKKDLVELVESVLGPIRAEYERIAKDAGELDRILDAGAAKARGIAEPLRERAFRAAGLGRR